MSEFVVGLLPLALVLVLLGLLWRRSRNAPSHAPAEPGLFLPVPEYRGPLAFFRRHWNGDYSLARSYWVNNFLVSLFAPMLGVLLLPWLAHDFPARYASAGVLAITALGVLAWCWAAAGTWASAGKHVRRGGSSGWATAAKGMICLGLLKTFGDLAGVSPALAEHMRVAAGEQAGAATQVEVRRDGRSVLVSGGINDGSAKKLEQVLKTAPAVTTVVLTSEGGWLREGEMLADVIRDHGLNTYVEQYCASACTIAFLAGKERAADPRAKIGFHAARAVGRMGQALSTDPESLAARNAYQRAGLPDAFIARALNTPSTAMWHPSVDEMLGAGVLTRRSTGSETAAFASRFRSREEVAADLKKLDGFAAIAERSPAEFESVVQVTWSKLRAGATDAEVSTAAREKLGELLPKYLPLATDATLIDYQLLMQEELESLRSKDPALCVEMAFPTGRAINFAALLPRELALRDVHLIARVMREADAKRAVKPTRREADRVAMRAVKGMSVRQRMAFGDPAVRASSSSAEVCDAAIKFFAGLNAIEQAERGPALRTLYASSF